MKTQLMLSIGLLFSTFFIYSQSQQYFSKSIITITKSCNKNITSLEIISAKNSVLGKKAPVMAAPLKIILSIFVKVVRLQKMR